MIATACTRTAPKGSPPSNGQGGVTKLVTHAFGEIAVPVNPTRIVVIDGFTVEALVALGIQPVGAPGVLMDNLLHLPSVEDGITDIGDSLQPNIERIAKLQPDLILSNKIVTRADSYALLSQIAPTVVFDGNGFTEWKQITQFFAEILGKEAEAAQLQTNYEAKIQEFRALLSEDPDQITVSVVSVSPNQVSTSGKEMFIGSVLEDAGVSRPPLQSKGRNISVSLELLSAIDADALFVMNSQSQTKQAKDSRAAVEQIKASPMWSQLKAVQARRVYEVDLHWWGMGYIAANLVLDDLMTYLPEPKVG